MPLTLRIHMVGGDERVGELGGDLAPGGERGLALVEAPGNGADNIR